MRAAALASLAEILSRQPTIASKPPPPLESALLEAAHDPDAQVRSVAAFALGLIDGETVAATLENLLHDADRLVRYNAAAALARRGDRRAVPVLCDMLRHSGGLTHSRQPATSEQDAPTDAAFDSASLQTLVTANALRAVELLLDAQKAPSDDNDFPSPAQPLTEADREELRKALETAAKGQDGETAERARRLLGRLGSRH
ncbi:MAG: hypothetical protein D6741_19640 [Planctomycetota bacterium]|nr:MAG: hypothetical protein D6741_19640 [Planctomycetota bacterium]